ncbi:solute carrier family 30 (zinc transporter), member 1 [Rhodotorula toruloides]|uniref:Solute carrier family 30 (Zinc transporter), member 1 n=1 Tax=Rhodotorula toruloides TaxID=5286 RepID=A0A511KQ71_RHOTO|nr:solute carrier family 30 (zinc transporter), member 1 [Rhodotorula toruloides]
MTTQRRTFKLKLLLASAPAPLSSRRFPITDVGCLTASLHLDSPTARADAVDTAFLFLELGVGIAVGSLALVADSFHMLNDVCSLIVALQALKLAENKSSSSKLSYGWQRAEVLGALINGVFLLALCFSIGMEAIARFVNYTEVTQPKLIVAVGSAGLLSNIIGLFLFHDHGGHSHGGGGHGHAHGASASTSKASHGSHSHANGQAHDEPSDRTPLLSRAGRAGDSSSPSSRPASPAHLSVSSSTAIDDADGSSDADLSDVSAEEELFVHPGELRANVLKKAHDAGYGATTGVSGTASQAARDIESQLGGDEAHEEGGHGGHGDHGGHGEGSMNMKGVFLHVLGDALGNVGVIAAGLFIWLTDYWWRSYFDPAVSLVITVIIFSSALPLVRSASFILLQGVPSSVPLERLRSSIAECPGVLNVHDLHVWSLSESKIVASVHIMVRGPDLVNVSREIKRRFHRFGIHSSTIQPEIVASPSGDSSTAPSDPSHISATARGRNRARARRLPDCLASRQTARQRVLSSTFKRAASGATAVQPAIRA